MTETHKPKPRPNVAARTIIVHEGHVLLLCANEPGRTWYFLPGGHAEHSEMLAETARREAREETGLEVIVERPLYLREFIAGRHKRRAKGMPELHHALALIFLCRIDGNWLASRDFRAATRFSPDANVKVTQAGAQWHALDKLAELEIHPPHLKRALMGKFPPPAEQGIEFWPED
ncbi:MAG: NUDIX domain-containing protein [Planctomycetes bacterium]|nr:NUDIX domain-containing protein [Planctomycetota bacterium]